MRRSAGWRSSPARKTLFGAALCLACAAFGMGCGYQIQLQPTGTPAPPAPLGVHRISAPGVSPTPAGDLQALIREYLGTPAPTAASARASAAPASATPAPAAATAVGTAGAAAALSLSSQAGEPVAAIASAPGSSQASPQASTVVPDATASPTSTVSPTGIAAAGPQRDQGLDATPMAVPTGRPAAAVPAFTYTLAASATPQPRDQAQAAPAPAPATSTPSVSVAAAALAGALLRPGPNDVTYTGPTEPATQAFASIAGKFDVVVFMAPGADTYTYYYPGGAGGAAYVQQNTWVRIVVNA